MTCCGVLGLWKALISSFHSILAVLPKRRGLFGLVLCFLMSVRLCGGGMF